MLALARLSFLFLRICFPQGLPPLRSGDPWMG
jgi:hypothetical protein